MPQWFLCILILLTACSPQITTPPTNANMTAATAIPTVNTGNASQLCAIVDDNPRNWAQLIDALTALQSLGASCGTSSVEQQLYTAYLGYGTQLEQAGRTDAAIRAYERALAINSQSDTADTRLHRLGHNTDDSRTRTNRCSLEETSAAFSALPDYRPTSGSFAKLHNNEIRIGDTPFPIYGVHYYPRSTPFDQFLTTTNLSAVANEFDLMRDTGLNTLRIVIHYAPLFICPANGAVPNADNVIRLDNIITLAAEKGFRLIPVLHHDTGIPPADLYTNAVPHVREQTRFLVERYADEPAILAWDIRNRGDIDYDTDAISRKVVLKWLASTIQDIRRWDANHLITASWGQDAASTAPLVDFVSVQIFGEYQMLRQTIANVRAATTKPFLLAAIGYSTLSIDEASQRSLLFQAFQEVEQNSGLGWIVYMAFDYPRDATCETDNCAESTQTINRYGVWNERYFPKLAVDAIRAITDSDE